MDTRLKRSVLKGVLASLGFVGAIAFAATFNLFQPATGILVGNSSTYITSAAAWSNIQSLLSGTCNSTVFVRGDGACTAVPAGVVPGGANTNVQYNSSGAFAGNSGFTYDGSGNISLTGRVSATGLNNQFGTTATGSFGAVLNLSSDTSHYSLHEATDGNGNQIALGTNNSGSTQAGLPTGTVGIGTTSVLPLHIATAGHGIFLDDNTTFSSGVVVGAPTGGNKGVGTLNAVGLYVGGVAVGTGGGGTPGGSSGQLQWNSGGTFAGVGGSTFTSATQQLELIPSAGNITALKATSNGTNDVEIVASNAASTDAYFRAVDLSGTNWSFGNQRSSSSFIIANGVGLASNPFFTLTTAGTLTIAGTINSTKVNAGGGVQIAVSNTDATTNGTFAQQVASNSSHSFHHLITGTAQSTAFITGGFAGESAYLYTDSGVPLCIGTGGSCRETIASTGAVSILPPSSGNALSVNGLSNAFTANITAGSTTNQSFGVILNAGTSTSDTAFQVRSQSTATDYFIINGAGGVDIGSGVTGGFQGLGSVNISGQYFQNGSRGPIGSCWIKMLSAGTGAPSVNSQRGCTSPSVVRNSAGSYTFSDAQITGGMAICTVNTSLSGPYIYDTVSAGGGSALINVFTVPGGTGSSLADIPSGGSLICSFGS